MHQMHHDPDASRPPSLRKVDRLRALGYHPPPLEPAPDPLRDAVKLVRIGRIIEARSRAHEGRTLASMNLQERNFGLSVWINSDCPSELRNLCWAVLGDAWEELHAEAEKRAAAPGEERPRKAEETPAPKGG